MAVYTISEVEKLTGIKSHNLRIWEKRYCLALSKRKDTNIRFYDDEDLKFLLQTANLLNVGYKISKIASMNDKERSQCVKKCICPSNGYDLLINQLTLAMIELDESMFQMVCDMAMAEMGVECMMFSVLYPFLDKIGLLWISDRINPAHEHFISHLIRQKLISEMDKLPIPCAKSCSKYLLFLPEGELHELSLLFLNYILRVRGNHTLYLGQNMPIMDVVNAIKYYKPHYVTTILTSSHKTELALLLTELSAYTKDFPVMIAGRQVCEIETGDYPDILFLDNPHKVIEWVEGNKKANEHLFAPSLS